MAKRSSKDTAAAKAKKQKIILIVGGVLLLAVAGIQVPKLLKGSGSSGASPVAAVTDGTAAAATGTPATPAGSPTGTAAVVAGVSLPRARVVKVETSQLASFTLFDVKDPFVQQAGDEPAGSATQAGASSAAGTPSSDSTATGASPSASGSTPSTTPPPPPAAPPVIYATIDFNSKPQQLQVKDSFPTPEPLFVLRSLTKKQAKIGVAGGSFDGGAPVTLKLGKKVTLVNTATGARYVLKLVYAGAQPEVIEGFTTAGSGASTVDAANATTTTP